MGLGRRRRRVGYEQPGGVPVSHRRRRTWGLPPAPSTRSGGAYGVAAPMGNVWVSNEYAGTLMRVTMRRPSGWPGPCRWRRPARPRLRRGGPVVHQRRRRQRAAQRRRPHHGRRAVVNVDDRPVIDPLTQYDRGYWRLAAMTNDGLVGFRRAGRGPGRRARPGPGHHPAGAHRRRADLHLPPAQGRALLHRGAGAGRRHPARHRTHRRPLQHRHSDYYLSGDRWRAGLPGRRGEGRRRQEAAAGLPPEQGHHRRRPDRDDHLPPDPADAGVPLPAGAARLLRGPENADRSGSRHLLPATGPYQIHSYAPKPGREHEARPRTARVHP